MSKLPRLLQVVCVLCFLSFVFPVLGRDMEREALIEGVLVDAYPEQLEVFRAARVALDAKNLPEAERLFRQVCTAAPNFDVAHRRLGGTLHEMGRNEEALVEFERAFSLEASAFNRLSLASLLAFPGTGDVKASDKQRALSLLEGCRGLPDGEDAYILSLRGQLALSLNKQSLFVEAEARSRTLYPDAISTHYFSAVKAGQEEHWILAEDEILKAEKQGLDHAVVERFLGTGIGSYALGWRLARGTSIAVSLWALGLGVLFASGFLLSKLTLSQAERADVFQAISPLESRLRKVYRQVLNIAGVYYYISLPVIMAVLLATCGLALYLFLLIGRIPLQLMFALAVGAIMTIYAMGRSLMVRVKEDDPGRALKREEAEALWTMTEEVAAAVGTRPIDEIRITPGTDLAVYERGTWREKMNNRATRILILGTAVLEGFQSAHFRSVLAHEYGHFSNRDTAGGEVALRVQRDMFNFYNAMYEAGQATMWNLGFHFLRLYNLIFRRISHGATRLQEILADRVAGQCYGADAFEGGLRHVVRRSIEFDRHAHLEIEAAIKAQRPLQNLYAPVADQSEDVEKAFEDSINRPTTPDDTHPGPKDRFRLIARLNNPSCPPAVGMVWDLFNDPQVLSREMTLAVEGNIARYRSLEDRTAKQLVGS